MTNFISVFPLDIVVFPGETLNLHIFEPRYKQMVKDCLESGRPFGIPVVLKKTVKEYGTLIEITAVEKEYENGEMDIRTRGVQPFRILESIPEIPEKLYSGAIVNYPEFFRRGDRGNRKLMDLVLAMMHELHKILKISKLYAVPESELLSFDIAHHVGLSTEQEYELLALNNETQRQEYLRRHLEHFIPAARETEALKEKIKLNGHFRSLKPED